MKVHELIKLLQEQNQDTEVRFSESFVSTVNPDERHTCGPEEGSRIFEIMVESSSYDDGTTEDHVVLLGEVLGDVPGLHFPPFEDERGSQDLLKEVPDPADPTKPPRFASGAANGAANGSTKDRSRDERERRAVAFARVPKESRDKPTEISKAHRMKYKKFVQALAEAKKGNAGLLIIAAPWVLGDDYEELIANMNLVAKAEMRLCIGSLDVDPNPDNEPFPQFTLLKGGRS